MTESRSALYGMCVISLIVALLNPVIAMCMVFAMFAVVYVTSRLKNPPL